jgi:hypothetical protein
MIMYSGLLYLQLLSKFGDGHRRLSLALAGIPATARLDRGRKEGDPGLPRLNRGRHAGAQLGSVKIELASATSIFYCVAPLLSLVPAPSTILYRSTCLPPTPPPPWLPPAKTLRCSWLLRFVRPSSIPPSSTNVVNSATSVPRTSRSAWSLTSGRPALTVSTSSTLARPGAFAHAAVEMRASRNFWLHSNFRILSDLDAPLGRRSSSLPASSSLLTTPPTFALSLPVPTVSVPS